MTARPLPPLLLRGDCIARMRDLPDASIDAVVTDPPYGLDFMGKAWDRYTPLDFEQWCATWAAEALRVLKPGGHLLAFGGSRTWHRLAAGTEDAGFEVRDSIAWLYGSGFPKSLDVSKAIDKAAGAEREVVGTRPGQDITGGNYNSAAGSPRVDLKITGAPATPEAAAWQGWGTALKPAFEPIVVARKPLAGTVAANVLQYGTGALNIDASRIGTTKDVPSSAAPPTNGGPVFGKWAGAVTERSGMDANTGRWPANVMLDEGQAAALDAQTGTLKSGGSGAARKSAPAGNGRTHGTMPHLGYTAHEPDSGGASRFFYVTSREGDSMETCDHATTAAPTSSQRSERDDSAQGGAVTSARLAERSTRLGLSVPSTSGTASGSRASGESNMRPIPSIGGASLPDSQRGKRTPTANHAASAVSRESDTMRTTGGPSISSGTADLTTSPGTSSSMGHGAAALPIDDLHERFRYVAKAPKSERPVTVDDEGNRVIHPTVKPLALMRYLVTLVTPPGGVVLDPFAGSGTTLEAAYSCGFESIGVELTPDYWPLIEARIERAVEQMKGA